MDRLCLDCHAPLKGRADKKFCDDQCRSNFNNSLRAVDHGLLRSINQILRRNREILKLKNPVGKTKVKRDALAKKGFDFDYHTHTYANKHGHTYFFCYEYGYLNLGSEEVLLVKREEK